MVIVGFQDIVDEKRDEEQHFIGYLRIFEDR